MKFLIESYGCQLNMAESAAIETMLIGRGLEKTENPDEADAVILNTCSVRKTAENRIWGRLGFYSSEKKKHKLILIVTGCMAERMQEELKTYPFGMVWDYYCESCGVPVGEAWYQEVRKYEQDVLCR